METEDYVSIIKNMLKFSNMVECVYPDQYKFVCHLHNIQEREAMDMYGDLRKIASGQYWSIKDKKDGYLYSMINMALEASKIQVFNSLIKDTAAIGEDRKPNILAFFKRGDERFQQEFNLQWQVAYLDIAEMIKNGYTLTATARQVDNVDAKDYVGENNGKPGFDQLAVHALALRVAGNDFRNPFARHLRNARVTFSHKDQHAFSVGKMGEVLGAIFSVIQTSD